MTEEERIRMGLRIRDARLQWNLRLDEMAGELGVARSHLANIERGRRTPSLETLVAIAGKLGVGLDYLVLGQTENKAEQRMTLRSDEELSGEYLDAIEALLEAGCL